MTAFSVVPSQNLTPGPCGQSLLGVP
jgi:hypothetical protein